MAGLDARHMPPAPFPEHRFRVAVSTATGTSCRAPRDPPEGTAEREEVRGRPASLSEPCGPTVVFEPESAGQRECQPSPKQNSPRSALTPMPVAGGHTSGGGDTVGVT